MNPCVWTLLLCCAVSCMPRYRNYGPRDDAPQRAGDRFFLGVNQRLAPEQLAEGMVAEAINLRFRNGRPVKRGGASKAPWLNKLDPHGNPGVVEPFDTVWGVGKFSDPDELEWNIFAADGAIYRIADGNSPESLELPAETRVDYPVDFTQAATALVLWRGTKLAPLAMTSVDTGFQTINAGVENYSYATTYADGDEVVFPAVPNQSWNKASTYGDGDLVLFSPVAGDSAYDGADNKHYLANTTTTAGDSPTTSPTKWDLVQWSPDTAYSAADTVIYSSTRYEVALNTDAGDTPLSAPEKFTLVPSKVYAANQTTSAADLPTGAKFDYERDLTPAAEYGLFAQNRLFVPSGRDDVLYSDILDYSVFVAQVNTFRINAGSADALVGLYKFNENTIICLKENSIYELGNVYGALSEAYLNEVTREYGCVARRSVVAVGADLWFLSQRGIVSLRQTEQNKLQGVSLPASDAVQPTLDRVNWGVASGACATYWDNKFYLALPLDDAQIWRDITSRAEQTDVREYQLAVTPGNTYRCTVGNDGESVSDGNQSFVDGQVFIASSTPLVITAFGVFPELSARVEERLALGNNAILVYDFLNQQWCGLDEGEAICPQYFFKARVEGRERLCFSGFDGYGNLYEEGATDDVYDGSADSELAAAEISTTLTTRAYQTADALTHWRDIELQVQTWDPSLTVTAIFPGINETQVLWEDWTRSRTAYYKPFNKDAYDATNANDDHGEADRQDYSIVLTDGFDLGSGVQLERMQATTLRKRLVHHDSAVQLELVNAQGRVDVKNIFVEGRAGKQRKGVLN